ncbi:hypothetical protein [Symbiopectobacterium purcellii]|uniref:hypothetical protein n=1 Tax=Symbiopectobacterium purcellii TaxID=2871826 RepID=UPI003F85DE1B
MGQIAFDTLQASEELQTAGLTSEQAKAISLVVLKSHEVADVATKRDLEDVRKDLKAVIQNHDAQLPICFEKTESKIMDVRKDFTIQITDVRKEMQARFEKTDAQIADVRKDLSAEIADVRKDIDARFEKNEAQIQARFEKTEAQISLVRKDLQLEMAGIRSEQRLIRWMLSAGILGILSLVVKAFLVTAL